MVRATCAQLGDFMLGCRWHVIQRATFLVALGCIVANGAASNIISEVHTHGRVMAESLLELTIKDVITDFSEAERRSKEMEIELVPSESKGEFVLDLKCGGFVLGRGVVLAIPCNRTGDYGGVILDISGGCCITSGARYQVRWNQFA